MNRKLRHSLSAFTASGAALAIALMVAVPAGPSPVRQMVSQDLPLPASAGQRAEIESLAKAVALSAELAAASALALEATPAMDAEPKQHAPRKGTRNRRQTIVMPYFSFLPRG